MKRCISGAYLVVTGVGLLLVACGGAASPPPASAIIDARRAVAKVWGNQLKDVEVTNLQCSPIGTAWGCSYDIQGIEILSNGRQVPFDRKRGSIKLEKRGEI
jgi:hypothetical protein